MFNSLRSPASTFLRLSRLFIFPLFLIAYGKSYILPRAIWNQYILTEWDNLKTISQQIDVLKYTISSECPIGDRQAQPNSRHRRSLIYIFDILSEARVSFELSFAKMTRLSTITRPSDQPDGRPMPMLVRIFDKEQMLKQGWDELWPVEEIRDEIRGMHDTASEALLDMSRIARSIDDLPGWEHDSTITDLRNIDDLARMIYDVETLPIPMQVGFEPDVVINPDVARMNFITNLQEMVETIGDYRAEFTAFKLYAKKYMAIPPLLDLIQHHDPNYGGGEREGPVMYSDLSEMMIKWFDCWISEFDHLIFLIWGQLGWPPKPVPESVQGEGSEQEPEIAKEIDDFS